MHLRKNDGPLEMTRTEKGKQAGATKNQVELDPGDEGRRVSPTFHGIFSSTDDTSSSFRLPLTPLTRC